MNLKDKEFWDNQVELNKDPYGKAVVDAAKSVMEALDAGESLQDAHDKMYGHGLSGFQAGCVAQIIARAHVRGDEFNDFWNGLWGKPAGTKGTVNPAVLIIDRPEE